MPTARSNSSVASDTLVVADEDGSVSWNEGGELKLGCEPRLWPSLLSVRSTTDVVGSQDCEDGTKDAVVAKHRGPNACPNTQQTDKHWITCHRLQ